MNDERNWLDYYKKSLFDSENLAIDITRIKNLYRQNTSDLSTPILQTKNANELIDAEERRINRLRGVTKKESSKWYTIEETKILIAPFHLSYSTSNSKSKNIYPFWIYATVNRAGQLTPPKEVFPLIARNYLAPIADVKNDFIFS